MDEDFKTRIRHITYCLIAMSILSFMIILIDPKLEQHLALLFAPWILVISCVVLLVVMKYKKVGELP